MSSKDLITKHERVVTTVTKDSAVTAIRDPTSAGPLRYTSASNPKQREISTGSTASGYSDVTVVYHIEPSSSPAHSTATILVRQDPSSADDLINISDALTAAAQDPGQATTLSDQGPDTKCIGNNEDNSFDPCSHQLTNTAFTTRTKSSHGTNDPLPYTASSSNDTDWEEVDATSIPTNNEDFNLLTNSPSTTPEIENGYPEKPKPLLRKAKLHMFKNGIFTATMGPLAPVVTPMVTEMVHGGKRVVDGVGRRVAKLAVGRKFGRN